jgi:hypothetical protein
MENTQLCDIAIYNPGSQEKMMLTIDMITQMEESKNGQMKPLEVELTFMDYENEDDVETLNSVLLPIQTWAGEMLNGKIYRQKVYLYP